MHSKHIVLKAYILFITLLFLLLCGCASETARVLHSVKSGMSIAEVRKLAGNESEIIKVGDKNYYLFRLFKDQSAKYFSNRSHYIVVAKDGKVIEWGEYQAYFPNK